MITLERIDAGPAYLRRRDPDAATSRGDEAAIAPRVGAAGSAVFWPTRLLRAPRRKAIYALHAFWRELDDIRDGEASRTLKLALLADWRVEIALLYAGGPQAGLLRAKRIKQWTFYRRDEARIREIKRASLAKV